jgi:hypothetical protein
MTRIDPTSDNLDRFAHKMDIGLRAIKAASSKSVRMKRIWKLRAYVTSWTAAFKLCADIGTIRHDALKRIAWAADMSEIHEALKQPKLLVGKQPQFLAKNSQNA